MLSCLHCFCRECLHREVERPSIQEENIGERPSIQEENIGEGPQPSSSIKCPLCSRAVSIPVGGVDVLPQDLHLDFETKVAQYQSRISQKSEVACDVCIDSSLGPALGFCCSCLHFLCKVCCDYHKRARHLHSHKIFTLGEEVAKEELFATIKPSEPSCSLHDQNKLRFYCETCTCSICRDCTVVAHKDHKCVELSCIAQSCRNEIKSLIASANDIMPKLARAIDTNIKVLEGAEASGKTVAQNIQDTFLLLQKALDDRMNQLLEDANSTTMSITAALVLQGEGFDRLKQDVSNYSNFSSHVAQAYTDHELMALKQLPLTELQAAIINAESVSLLPCKSSEVKVCLQKNVLIRELSNLGYVTDINLCPTKSTWKTNSLAILNSPFQLKVKSLDSSGQKYLLGDLQVAAKIQPQVSGYQAVEGQVEDHEDGTYTITLTPLTAGPHQLLITIDGQDINNSPYNLEVRHSKPNYNTMNGGYKVLNTSIMSPLCIAIHENGDMFIGSEINCIYVLDQKGVQKSVIGSMGNGPGQFDTPSGLAIKEDVLYVADCNNHRIQKLKISGESIDVIGKFGSSLGEFNCPCALVVDANDKLIVADRGNCRIQVMNIDGTCLSSINGNQLESICGLAGLDPEGNIHVLNSSKVTVISPDGALVKTYGNVPRQQVVHRSCSKHCRRGGHASICSYYQLNAGAIDYQGYSLILEDAKNLLHVFDSVGNEPCVQQIPGGKLRGIALSPSDGSVCIVTRSLQYNEPCVQQIPGGKLRGIALSPSDGSVCIVTRSLQYGHVAIHHAPGALIKYNV